MFRLFNIVYYHNFWTTRTKKPPNWRSKSYNQHFCFIWQDFPHFKSWRLSVNHSCLSIVKLKDRCLFADRRHLEIVLVFCMFSTAFGTPTVQRCRWLLMYLPCGGKGRICLKYIPGKKERHRFLYQLDYQKRDKCGGLQHDWTVRVVCQGSAEA